MTLIPGIWICGDNSKRNPVLSKYIYIYIYIYPTQHIETLQYMSRMISR